MDQAHHTEKAIVTVCLGLFVIGLLSTVLAIHFPERLRGSSFDSDGVVFLRAVQDYTQGRSLYITAPPPSPPADLQPYLTRFLYPPVAVWILYPFFIWPGGVAGPVWMGLTCLLFLAVAFHMAAAVARRLALPAPTAVAAVMTLTLGLWYPFLAHLGIGQVDVLVLALCYYAALSRQRHPVAAAAALALATGLKLFPILLVIYIVIADRGRAWRFLGAYALIVAVLAALAVFCFGRGTFAEWIAATSYREAHVNPYLGNQSVIGTLSRLLDPGDVPLYLALKHALQMLAPLLGGLAVWLASRRRPLGAVALLSAFVMAYALASPLFWIQSYVLFLPVIILLAREVLEPTRRGQPARYLIASLLVAALAIQFTAWFDPPPAALLPGFNSLVYHRYVLSQLLLAAGLVLALFGRFELPSPPLATRDSRLPSSVGADVSRGGELRFAAVPREISARGRRKPENWCVLDTRGRILCAPERPTSAPTSAEPPFHTRS
jgi:hypothetical protein